MSSFEYYGPPGAENRKRKPVNDPNYHVEQENKEVAPWKHYKIEPRESRKPIKYFYKKRQQIYKQIAAGKSHLRRDKFTLSELMQGKQSVYKSKEYTISEIEKCEEGLYNLKGELAAINKEIEDRENKSRNDISDIVKGGPDITNLIASYIDPQGDLGDQSEDEEYKEKESPIHDYPSSPEYGEGFKRIRTGKGKGLIKIKFDHKGHYYKALSNRLKSVV